MSTLNVTQADTLNVTGNPSPEAPLGGGGGAQDRTALRTAAPNATDWFWRAVPVLFGLAAWLPQIWSSFVALSRFATPAPGEQVAGGFLQRTITQVLGQDGLVIAGAVVSGFITYTIWALARAIGAPRWAAAIVASLWVVSPLFGFAPSPVTALDDAVFGGVMTLALAVGVWTGRREDSNCLMIALILATIAAALRPGALWPALAIGLGAWCASRHLEEGPWLGMFSSLCWAPGLYFAQKLIAQEDRPASLTDTLDTAPLAQSVRDGAQAGVAAVETASLSLPVILNGLLSALPFVIFGAVACVGLGIVYLLGKSRRRGAIVGGVGTAIAILGAAGYGSLDAARLLLDPIFLGLAGAIGLILPALWKRYQQSRNGGKTA